MSRADARPPVSQHDLDILSAVARITQYAKTYDSLLLDRLVECDVPRLLALVDPHAIAWAETTVPALLGLRRPAGD